MTEQTSTERTVRVFYSNDPPYTVGVPVRFWVDDYGRILKAEDVARHDAWLRGEPTVNYVSPTYGPLGHGRKPLDGGWQDLRPEQTRRCRGCHNAHVATTLSPGGYCAVCQIKWNRCPVCGADRLHGLHSDEEWAAVGAERPATGYWSLDWMPGDPA